MVAELKSKRVPYSLTGRNVEKFRLDIDLNLVPIFPDNSVLFYCAWHFPRLGQSKTQNTKFLKELLKRNAGRGLRILFISSFSAGIDGNSYSREKRECEKLVIEAQGSAFRLGINWGAENRFLRKLRLISKFRIIPPPKYNNEFFTTNVESAAQILTKGIDTFLQRPGVYGIAERHPTKLSKILEILNHEKRMFVIPELLFDFTLRIPGIAGGSISQLAFNTVEGNLSRDEIREYFWTDNEFLNL